MPHVNVLKQVNIAGRWRLRSIPRKRTGGYDWSALRDGRYFIEWHEQDLLSFFTACDDSERALFLTFLLTGFREQEVMYPFWSGINADLRTIRATSKAEHGFYPKRWEEREVPIPAHLAEILQNRVLTYESRS
jgi:hypothetical protein